MSEFLPDARHQFSDLERKLRIIVSNYYMINNTNLFKSRITNASCFGIFLVLSSYVEIYALLRFVLCDDKVRYHVVYYIKPEKGAPRPRLRATISIGF